MFIPLIIIKESVCIMKFNTYENKTIFRCVLVNNMLSFVGNDCTTVSYINLSIFHFIIINKYFLIFGGLIASRIIILKKFVEVHSRRKKSEKIGQVVRDVIDRFHTFKKVILKKLIYI